MSKHNFKVGDKVKILPSAIEINIVKSEIGKSGIIVDVYDDNEGYNIKTASKQYGEWWIRERDITPLIKVGQQLVFSFMD